MSDRSLKGRVALVTGAGGTMGRAVVDARVAQGCRVGMVDLNREAMHGSEARFGDAVFALACDLGDATAVTAAHAELAGALGGIDILVNNAGALNKLDATTAGVTANAIAPAYVRTPMVTEQLDEAQRQALLKQMPVGRFCEPEEFAHVVCFLASPLSGFITGGVIDLNGGLLMD